MGSTFATCSNLDLICVLRRQHPQSCQPIRLLRPYQCFQPVDLAGDREAHWIKVESRPPDDARWSCRDRRRGIDRAGKDGRRRTRCLGTKNSPAIIMAGEVGEQAETGRRRRRRDGHAAGATCTGMRNADSRPRRKRCAQMGAEQSVSAPRRNQLANSAVSHGPRRRFHLVENARRVNHDLTTAGHPGECRFTGLP